MIHVIAKTGRQAENWRRDQGLGPDEVRYVVDPTYLRGFHDVEIVFVGTWYERDDAHELQAEATLAAGVRTVERRDPT